MKGNDFDEFDQFDIRLVEHINDNGNKRSIKALYQNQIYFVTIITSTQDISLQQNIISKRELNLLKNFPESLSQFKIININDLNKQLIKKKAIFIFNKYVIKDYLYIYDDKQEQSKSFALKDKIQKLIAKLIISPNYQFYHSENLGINKFTSEMQLNRHSYIGMELISDIEKTIKGLQLKKIYELINKQWLGRKQQSKNRKQQPQIHLTYETKLKSLAKIIIQIILQKPIDLLPQKQQDDNIEKQQVLSLLQERKSKLQQLLKDKDIQSKIKQFQDKNQLNYYYFIYSALIKDKQKMIWSDVINLIFNKIVFKTNNEQQQKFKEKINKFVINIGRQLYAMQIQYRKRLYIDYGIMRGGSKISNEEYDLYLKILISNNQKSLLHLLKFQTITDFLMTKGNSQMGIQITSSLIEAMLKVKKNYMIQAENRNQQRVSDQQYYQSQIHLQSNILYPSTPQQGPTKKSGSNHEQNNEAFSPQHKNQAMKRSQDNADNWNNSDDFNVLLNLIIKKYGTYQFHKENNKSIIKARNYNHTMLSKYLKL